MTRRRSASGTSSPADTSPTTSSTQPRARLDSISHASGSRSEPQFPVSSRPRVWFLTAGDSPICVSVARQLLDHGDHVVAGLDPTLISGREGSRAELEALADEYSSRATNSTPGNTASEDVDSGDYAMEDDEEEDEDELADEDMPDATSSRQNKRPPRSPGSLTLVQLTLSSLSSIQAAYAHTLALHARIDVLLVASSTTVIGTVEELATSPRSQSLLREQFSTNFFGPVSAIKAILPIFRHAPPPIASSASPVSPQKQNPSQARRPSSDQTDPSDTPQPPKPLPPGGHIVLLSGVAGHLGTPGLGAYCAAQWAIEGYCDSLAYEVAPFNVRLSILQSNIEVGVLTNPLAAAPAAPAYGVGSFGRAAKPGAGGGDDDDDADPHDDRSDADADGEKRNQAPLARGWLGSLVGRLEAASGVGDERSRAIVEGAGVASVGCPAMPVAFRDALIAETVHAVLAIGGHENPPARHIVGHEGVASVKEKLKTVSEELEDFVAVSIFLSRASASFITLRISPAKLHQGLITRRLRLPTVTMTRSIDEDSDMPEPLNTLKKQEQRAKQLATVLLGKKARRVAAPNIQGFFSRTRIVTMVGGEKVVIQFRIEPLATEYFERARSALGEVVPSIQHIADEELEGLGITTYAMSYMPGTIWARISDSRVADRVSIASSLGATLARGFVHQNSSAVVQNFIVPHLSLIRDSLDQSANVLIPHIDRLIASTPALKFLPLWISHYDLNEANVLVDEDHKVSGIVDWELSQDLPFGMGFHRVCDTIVGQNVQGHLELPFGHDLAEAAFWGAVWDGMSSDARRVIENNLESFAAAINIGSLFFTCTEIEPSTQVPRFEMPSARHVSFLEAILTYRPPHTRGQNQPFGAQFMT